MSDRMSESASPPRKGRTQPLGLSDEAPSLIEKEQVDVERAIPIEGNEPAASKYVTTTWLNDHECEGRADPDGGIAVRKSRRRFKL